MWSCPCRSPEEKLRPGEGPPRWLSRARPWRRITLVLPAEPAPAPEASGSLSFLPLVILREVREHTIWWAERSLQMLLLLFRGRGHRWKSSLLRWEGLLDRWTWSKGMPTQGMARGFGFLPPRSWFHLSQETSSQVGMAFCHPSFVSPQAWS